MKRLIVLSSLLVPLAAHAQESSQVVVNAPTNDPNERVCRNIAETGSRLSHQRICRTRAQWDEERRTTRQNVERSQTNRGGRQY
jgi:hypothetical protein